MKTPRLKKTWVAVVGIALAVSTAGGVALAVDDPTGPEYTGGNATVADPHEITASPLKLYDAAGAVVTSGSATTPIAFAAADAPVATGYEYASLFVHLPQTTTAPGAWPGVQVSGTDKFTGTGAVTAPGAVAGKTFVTGAANGYTLSDVATLLPQTSTDPEFVGVYQLRLRISSATAGVSDLYDSAYVKVAGGTWTQVDAPTLGGGGTQEPTSVPTSVAVTWPAKITYGTAATVKATVSAASGSATPTGTAKLLSGATTIGTATLSPAGVATFTVAKTALLPGSRVLKVTYAGVTDAFDASTSAPKTFTVAKATPGKPTFAVTKKPTSKLKGKATVTVTTPSGLTKAGGKATITIKKGAVTKKVTVSLVSGKATATLPKLPKGTWTVTVGYAGDTRYLASASKKYTLKITK